MNSEIPDDSVHTFIFEYTVRVINDVLTPPYVMVFLFNVVLVKYFLSVPFTEITTQFWCCTLYFQRRGSRNVSRTVRTLKYRKDIHCAPTKNPNNHGGPWTFYLTPSAGQSFHIFRGIYQYIYIYRPAELAQHCAYRYLWFRRRQILISLVISYFSFNASLRFTSVVLRENHLLGE